MVCEDVVTVQDDSHIALDSQAFKSLLGQILYFFAPRTINSTRGKNSIG